VRMPNSGDPKDIIQKKEKSGGFKVDFRPGLAFFDDYDAYYVRRERPIRTTADDLMDEVTEPILVVAHFHELLGHDHPAHDEKLEFACATKLINELGLPAVRDLAGYTVASIREAGYDTRKTKLFNLVNDYRPSWEKDQRRKREFEKRQADIAACPDCNDNGMVSMRNHTGATTVVPCPHDGELLMAYEERENLRRMPN
jgi:hypothetical protein